MRAPQTGHEGRPRRARLHVGRRAVGARGDNWQAVDGCRRDIDVWRVGVVEHDAERLADVARGEGEGLRRADELRVGRPAHAPEIDNAQRRAAEIDEGHCGGVFPQRDACRLRRAGKAGDGRFARLDDDGIRGLRARAGGAGQRQNHQADRGAAPARCGFHQAQMKSAPKPVHEPPTA